MMKLTTFRNSMVLGMALTMSAGMVFGQAFGQGMPVHPDATPTSPGSDPGDSPTGDPPHDPQPLLPKGPGQRPGQLPGRPGVPREKKAEDLVTVHAVSDRDEIEAGKTFYIAVIFDIDPAWHIYWKNWGSSGAATEVRVNGPMGFDIGETLYPRPTTHEGEEGISYVYEGQVALLVPVTPRADFSPSAGMFSIDVSWLVCKDICLKGSAKRTVNVGGIQLKHPGDDDADAASLRKFARAELKRVPRELSEAANGKASYEDGKLTVTVSAPATVEKKSGDVYPLLAAGVEFTGKAEVTEDEGLLTMTIPVEIHEENAMGKGIEIKGLVVLGDKLTDPSYEFALAISPEGSGDHE